MEFNKLKENIITNINKFIDSNDKKLESQKRLDRTCKCPYCGNSIEFIMGYHSCIECKNNYRIYKNNIYKNNETINDVLYYFIKILVHTSNINGYISDEKLDYIYYIVKEEVRLDANKVKWCALIFKDTGDEVYTSEVIQKFKHSLKKYYGYNYNIERLSMFKWIINLLRMDEVMCCNQEKILNDYIKIFNINEVDYMYIDYPEVSISRE